MNSEQIAEFNIKAAEYMGWMVHPQDNNGVAMIAEPCGPDGSDIDFWPFDPYHDANDRNKVLEKMQAQTWYSLEKWWTTSGYREINQNPDVSGNSMGEAQNNYIASVLGVNK